MRYSVTFADGSDFTVEESGSLSHSVIMCDDYAGVQAAVSALTKHGNMKHVQFKIGEGVNGDYHDMALTGTNFSVKPTDYGYGLVFGIRELSEEEKRLENLEDSQNIQDGAIADLADIVGEI